MKYHTTTKNPEKEEWDVIVVGTGMGGAVIGHAMAKAGKSVLFCEKGKSHLSNPDSLKGDYAENFFSRSEISGQRYFDVLARAGRWNDQIGDTSTPRTVHFVPFIGSGTGGSSALFGMAMERFFPADFVPRKNYPDEEESALPETWPITYEQLLRYYIAAEQLFRVHGTGDPLRNNELFDHLLLPPSFSFIAEELYDFLLNKKGLHPYRLPMACEFVPGCECCQSYLCNKDCKNDSARICLKPAISDFGASLLDGCEVLKLEATKSEVTGVVCFWRSRQVILRGKVIILAANALETPRILLNSLSSSWPRGLANESGLVGRNLMRHYIDLYAIKPETKKRISPNLKEIAFNDFYVCAGQKFGTVQSFGSLPPASVLTDGIEKELRRGSLSFVGPLFGFIKPFISFILSRFFSQRIILAGIMEDLPHRDNMVMLSDRTDNLGRKQLILKYRIREYDHYRIEAFRREISELLKPYPFKLIKQAENNERIAHACGTCRFGLDPKESVLDADNRAHGISNLYVVDSSFFPSSGGTNPALTIAANALRVADCIVETWKN